MKLTRRLLFGLLTGAGGALLNVSLSLGAQKLQVPMYLDTPGTIAAVLYGGIGPGCAAALLTNSALNFIFAREAKIYFLFVLCNIATAFITWWFCGKGGLLSPQSVVLPVNRHEYAARRFHAAIERCVALFLLAITLVAAVSVLGGFIAWIINAVFAGPSWDEGWQDIPSGWPIYGLMLAFSRYGVGPDSMGSAGAGSLAAQILARLPVNIPDRLISVYGAYTLVRLLPKKREEPAASTR